MTHSRKPFHRRDFLKHAGIAASAAFGGASAIGSALHSPKGREIFGPHELENRANEMKLIKPRRLKTGDVVGVVAPASPLPHPDAAARYMAALKQFGFKPRLAPNARRRLGFLAGTDEERAEDLMAMFADADVKAIFCLRGGYGSARLLPLLDFRFIRKHPKIFIGFSDITSLHCAFMSHAGFVSFHGPTLNTSLTANSAPRFTVDSLLRTVMQPSASGSICAGTNRDSVTALRSGVATGRLVGGNLSVLCAAMGTPFQPSFKNGILFFEDVDEEPYCFDRMLTQLSNAGVLRQVSGVAVGTNAHCSDPKAAGAREFRQTLIDVLKDRLLPLGVPVVAGLPFGHVRRNATLPMGVTATLDADNGDLIITEAAVI